MDVDVVRVFTRGREGGNHLGIVGRVLDPGRMQAIAVAVGFSETIFLDPDEDEPTVRIFTPTAELPFAGHPLVGVTWWLYQRNRHPVVLHTGIGPVQVGAVDGMAEFVVDLGRPVHTDQSAPVGLEAGDVAVVEMPRPYVVCVLPSAEAVSAVVPDPGWGEVYAWARLPDGRVHARFFAGGLGVAEDPATGSAAVALVERLVVAGEDEGHVLVSQGAEMGHPSRLAVSWHDGRVTVSGSVVAESPLAVPD
ncbi:MAG: PhzF family phenazine biosynthesis protein [Acidimicrobiia bacterium]